MTMKKKRKIDLFYMRKNFIRNDVDSTVDQYFHNIDIKVYGI